MMKYVQIYFDFIENIESLTFEERGHLFTEILRYAMDGEMPEFHGNERYVFPSIKNQIDRDHNRYREICEARAEFGQRGGLAKASKSKQKVAKVGKSSQDKDKDKEKDNTPTEYSADSAFEIAMNEFREHRKSIKAPLNELSEKKIRNELERLTDGDEEKKIQILDQSIRNGWKGVFQLKDDRPVRNYSEHHENNLDHLLVNLDEVMT